MRGAARAGARMSSRAVSAAARAGAPTGAPVALLRRNPAALVRLVCFAHAGGASATFRHWPEALTPDVELWVATLPGRAGRAHEPCATSWPPLVGDLAGALAEHVAEPVALFGHSLGGLLAFEVARQLMRGTRVEPCHLIVSARGAPELRLTLEIPSNDEDLLEQVGRLYGRVPAPVREEPELLALMLPVLRADIELVRSYVFVPDQPLRCPITVLGGDADPTVPRTALDGWAAHTTAGHEVHQLAGGHFYLEQQRGAVLEIIRRRLNL